MTIVEILVIIASILFVCSVVTCSIIKKKKGKKSCCESCCSNCKYGEECKDKK